MIDIKIVQKCIDCKKKLPPVHKHHLRCTACWNKYQEKIIPILVHDQFTLIEKENKNRKFYSERERLEKRREKEFGELLR